MRRALLLGAMLAALAAQTAAGAEIVKLSVLGDGRVLMDGNPVTPEALDQRLAGARKSGVVVWYYRDNAAQEPSAAQAASVDAVLSRVTRACLPIRLFMKPDFSDVVRREGRPPRSCHD